MGWGATDHLSLASDVLLEVTISLFNHTECSSFFRNDETKLSLGIIEETQICSGSRNDEKGACGVSEFYIILKEIFLNFFFRVIVEDHYRVEVPIFTKW